MFDDNSLFSFLNNKLIFKFQMEIWKWKRSFEEKYVLFLKNIKQNYFTETYMVFVFNTKNCRKIELRKQKKKNLNGYPTRL